MDEAAYRILYIQYMDRLRLRLQHLMDAMDGKFDIPDEVLKQNCFLQLRLACELIAIAMLLGHSKLEGLGKVDKLYRPRQIMEELERINPKFFPIPCESRLLPSESDKRTWGLFDREPTLTKKGLQEIFWRCGDHVHVENLDKLTSNSDSLGDDFWSRIREDVQSIWEHMQMHYFSLPDGSYWVATITAKGTEVMRTTPKE